MDKDTKNFLKVTLSKVIKICREQIRYLDNEPNPLGWKAGKKEYELDHQGYGRKILKTFRKK